MQRKLFRTASIAQRQENPKFEEISDDLFYTIECRQSCFCLRSEPKSYKMQEGDSLRITGNVMEANYMNQLWMFKKLTQAEYEIVHVKTDLVITIDDYEAKLEMGRQKPNQRFEIVPYKNGFLRIKDHTGSVLHLDGILELVNFNERDETQLFRLKAYGIFQIPWLKDTIFILTSSKTGSLDLVNAAREHESEIIIYKKNMRMNQRWLFEIINEGKSSNYISVHILSALTKMYVVYSKQTQGLMQASYPEEWIIEQTEIKEFIYIRHAKLGEYLSYSEMDKIYFSQTKKSKWYVQNSQDGFHMKKEDVKRIGLKRTITI